jgi:hypothetical protein
MAHQVFRPIFVKQQLVLDRRGWVYYLILNENAAQRWGEVLEARPDERFFQVVSDHVKAYVEEGKMPPPEIETAIMNAADDYLEGRDITLRAGDYIALQSYARGKYKAA